MSTHSTTVPRRPFGNRLSNSKLPPDLPIVGLGCSSFSTFFWTTEEHDKYGTLTVDNITTDHPRVQEWMETIRYAVLECGIDLLDTAPWYGHGTSEIVIGFAMDRYPELRGARTRMTINTKVGRYEADPALQFDFSRETTLHSVERSIQRMKCDYIDVLQLHDPEFAPTLDILMKETLPAMREAQKRGQCKALGMTGYPLHVQYQILQEAMRIYGQNIFDQALTYGHFNLHNTRLVHHPVHNGDSFADYCIQNGMGLLAAAPLSMGLLTPTDSNGKLTVADWHPASSHLKEACENASTLCSRHGINIADLATMFAISEPRITCTIIGCKNIAEVQRAAQAANRFQEGAKILDETESKVLEELQEDASGPFVEVLKLGEDHWDGILAVRLFWASLPSSEATHWQTTPIACPP
jgi:L-galactose dehydrogenase